MEICIKKFTLSKFINPIVFARFILVFFLMKRNLVAGGAGFIGSHLVDKLIHSGEYVICLDDLSSGNYLNIKKWEGHKNFKFIKGSILEQYDLKFDTLWHFACPASPKRYLEDPILTSRINFEGTLNLLNMAKNQKSEFIFASSSEVYGNSNIFPQKENNLGYLDTKSIKSCYAHGKRLAETLCFDFQRSYQMNIKVGRIFNTYGPRLDPFDGRVISNFINQALQNKPLTIYSNGKQTRSFCFVSDVIDAFILLNKTKYNMPINIGNSDEISILDLANCIDKKIRSLQNYSFFEENLEETIRRCPSLEIINKFLNWEPQTSLSDGLDKTINYFKDGDMN